MNAAPQIHDVDNRTLIEGLRRVLDMSYTRMLETARREWERNCAGKDSSDACVSVHVTSGDSKRPGAAPKFSGNGAKHA
jgi:hypothetical protein